MREDARLFSQLSSMPRDRHETPGTYLIYNKRHILEIYMIGLVDLDAAVRRD